MSIIAFYCPSCSAKLNAKPSQVGKVLECPACAGDVVVGQLKQLPELPTAQVIKGKTSNAAGIVQFTGIVVAVIMICTGVAGVFTGELELLPVAIGGFVSGLLLVIIGQALSCLLRIETYVQTAIEKMYR